MTIKKSYLRLTTKEGGKTVASESSGAGTPAAKVQKMRSTSRKSKALDISTRLQARDCDESSENAAARAKSLRPTG
jgi:hypothetical protein